MTTPLSNEVVNDANANDDRPDIPHDAYARMKPRWEKCRALMVGTEAIRDGEETYLPRLENETDASYDFRRELVALHNGYKRTVLAATGFLLETPPTLGEDMPQRLVDFAENVDRAGTHLNVFTHKLVKAGTVDGYAGIMAEHTRVPDPAKVDADEEERLGIGPYWLLYKVSDVVKPVHETVNGVKTLTLLILRETSRRRSGKFGVKTVTRYRVYTNDRGTVRAELWEAVGNGAPAQVGNSATVIRNQKEIPWSPIALGEEIAANEWVPPLIDLADLTIEHYNCKTNIRTLETLACVPTQVRIGAKRITSSDDPAVVSGAAAVGDYPPIELGPRSTIEAPAMQGVAQPVYWHSPDVSVLSPAQASLDKIEQAMGAAGMAFLAPDTRAAETAEARRIDSGAQRATLATVAQATQDCLERAFQFTANYLNETAGSVTVNKDFTGEGYNVAVAQLFVDLWKNQAVTLEEMRHAVFTGQPPEDTGNDKKEMALLELLGENVDTGDEENANADATGAAA